jgi:hypothetical protein
MLRNKEELHAITSAKRLYCKNKALSVVRHFRREPLVETEGPEFESLRAVNLDILFEHIPCYLKKSSKRCNDSEHLSSDLDLNL